MHGKNGVDIVGKVSERLNVVTFFTCHDQN